MTSQSEQVSITYMDENGTPIGAKRVSSTDSLADPVMVEFGCNIRIHKAPTWQVVDDVDVSAIDGEISLYISLQFASGLEVDPFVANLVSQGLARAFDKINSLLARLCPEPTGDGKPIRPEWTWSPFAKESTMSLYLPAGPTTTYAHVVQTCAELDELVLGMEPRARELAVGVILIADESGA